MSFGKLEIEITVDDPEAYTAPWTVVSKVRDWTASDKCFGWRSFSPSRSATVLATQNPVVGTRTETEPFEVTF
jgi:hypothetical protein